MCSQMYLNVAALSKAFITVFECALERLGT
jgi:hypothetical protein